jgi:hypothetical protein
VSHLSVTETGAVLVGESREGGEHVMLLFVSLRKERKRGQIELQARVWDASLTSETPSFLFCMMP